MRQLLQSSGPGSKPITAAGSPYHSASGTSVVSAKELGLLDELATERIIAAYSSPAVKGRSWTGKNADSGIPVGVRTVVLKWLQGAR